MLGKMPGNASEGPIGTVERGHEKPGRDPLVGTLYGPAALINRKIVYEKS